MKLSDHVDKLRNLIEAAFDKQFARLGIAKARQLDIEKLPEEVKAKRVRYQAILENHIEETGDYEHAREKLIDELTFTLFNRLAAVKVMEAAALFPPVLTKQPEHGDRSFGHKAWLEMNPHMRSEELEGIREYIKYAFDGLGETLPLYSKAYPYALLPDAISLNEIIDAFNAVEKDSQVGSEIWQSDDVLGWMYESYNNVKKKAHKDSGDKTEYDKVGLQSQVYTPRWVVQFLVQNSLGKLYLEMYPDSEIKRRYKIANAPQTRERKPKPLHEVKTIDPACGSGNFLLYAFDFFYELYVDQIENYGADYDETDIPKLIIENNLHGIDLDDRAVQLAQLGLFIKAKKKQRTIGELKFNVVSSDFYLPEYEVVKEIFEPRITTDGHQLDPNQKALIREVWSDLQYAYKFGSLIRLNEKVKSSLHQMVEQRDKEQERPVSDKDMVLKRKALQPNLFTKHDIEEKKQFSATFFTNLKTAVEQYAQAQGNTFLTSKTRDAITFLELLTTEYDVATANPPYTDSGDFGSELRAFINANYKKPFKFHTNLYATFIKRCHELTAVDGKIAMIHPNTFMFIKSFDGVRSFLLNKVNIDLLVDYGMDRVNLFGGDILLDSNSFYVLSKESNKSHGAYFNIAINQQEKHKKNSLLKALDDIINEVDNERVSFLDQAKFKIIESCPFIYWISDEFREKFELATVDSALAVRRGCETNNNNRFLRFWWEASLEKVEGFCESDGDYWPYAKGGPFNKWYGNVWLTIDFRPNSRSLISEYGNLTSEEYYGKDGISYSASGQKGPSFRRLPEHAVFDVGGSSIFAKNYCNTPVTLAYMNSKLVSYILDCLNPTVNTQIFDIKRLPFVFPPKNIEERLEALSLRCVEIKKHLCSLSLLEMDFKNSPIDSTQKYANKQLTQRVKQYFEYENHLLAQININEAIIDEKVFEVYDLTEHDKAMVLAKKGESIGGLPVTSEARAAYLAETEATKEFPLDAIRAFIDALPSKEFSAEQREAIESGFGTLYQSNNDLEEFCIRHQVNPINVWYWFKQSNVIPQQRVHTLSMEFLADMVREILMEDKDGMIPLVPNAGEKVLLDRIDDKFREKGFSSAQYSSFDSVLGRPMSEYLINYFFAELSDHLNLFMYLPKTPFIWHLSSGPEQGFDCYIIIYKWSRDKLLRLRSVYIEHRERSLVNRQSDLSGKDSADAQNEKDRIFRQLKEIEAFKTKIDELLAEGYNPILDDGVGKNIAPLQEKGLIPYEVLNENQLKTYLNADW